MLIAHQLQTERDHQSFTYDFTLQRGEMGLVLGRSGGGKSTLFALLAGFLDATGGELTVDGHTQLTLRPEQRPFTLLFQKDNLFHHLTVRQNIGLGISPRRFLKPSEMQLVEAAAERLQIAEWLDNYPSSLSGGQQQRVALARCLVRRKPYLLLDEPFSALDPALRREMMQLVRQLATEQKMGVLLVSHQPAEARAIADWIGFIDEGKWQFTADVDALELPPTAAFAAYLGTDHNENTPGRI